LRQIRLIAALTVLPAFVAVLSGCGAEPVAVRVGEATITSEAVAHWMSVLAPEHFVPDPPKYTRCVTRERTLSPPSAWAGLEQECRQEYHTLERRALALLISSTWLTSTTAQDGLQISSRELETRVREGPESAAEGGDAGDARLVAVAELAEAKIRRRLARSEHAVSDAEIADYYQAHRRQFLVPEKRYFDIENLKSQASALRIKREVESGRSRSFLSGILHEMIEQPSSKYGSEETSVRRAILHAKMHVLTGPLLVGGEHSLFEVTRFLVARYQPLARVHGAIERQLTAEQRRLTLSRFIVAWRKYWTAKTDCYPGYLVQQCRRYAGPRTQESQTAFMAQP
jgi:hypothetical protein